MDTLLDRFCRYVRIDTQADEAATTHPSSTGQRGAGGRPRDDPQPRGRTAAAQKSHGIVLATTPATVKHRGPTMAWNAHVDTSPETSGHNVKPIVHRNYNGADIILPGDTSK